MSRRPSHSTPPPHPGSESGVRPNPAPPSEYELVDSGDGQKLERFGSVTVVRPCPQALWRPTLDASSWDEAQALYERNSSGGGRWTPRAALPDQWECRVGELRMLLRGTGFGHVGVFPEQVDSWRWLRERARPGLEVLNLFAYTGGSTVAAALGGAAVTHCDASRGVVQWASENVRLNGLDRHPIRWIVDDALKFLRRDARRGRVYHGVVLDPPSFGRGPKGEVWKLEQGIAELLEAAVRVLHPDQAAFVLLSAHTPGLGPQALENLLLQVLGRRSHRGACGHGEMTISATRSPYPLPSGTWALWTADGMMPTTASPSIRAEP